MSRFIQLHVLTSYPASNLNRDDLGRPKTVRLPDGERLRVSSQSLKRAWRCSEAFQQALAGNLGTRTKEVGKYVYLALTSGATFLEALRDQNAAGDRKKLAAGRAKDIACTIGGAFGVMQKDGKKGKGKKGQEVQEETGERQDDWKPFKIEQLAHLSPAELEGVNALVEQCRESGKIPSREDLNLLRKDEMAVDIALFGRMLTKGKSETDEKDDTKQDDKENKKSSGIALQAYNVEAAAQVAHAMTVHKVVVEEDFFTAVDDLNRIGAGHVDVAEFGAGLFYLYLCIDRELLVENLGGNEELAARALDALTRAVCTVSPTGKQNSFASRAVASFCLAEKGDAQPRTLAEAFMPGLTGGERGDVLTEAIEKLEAKRAAFNRIMGEEADSRSYTPEQGTLAEVAAFAAA